MKSKSAFSQLDSAAFLKDNISCEVGVTGLITAIERGLKRIGVRSE